MRKHARNVIKDKSEQHGNFLEVYIFFLYFLVFLITECTAALVVQKLVWALVYEVDFGGKISRAACELV